MDGEVKYVSCALKDLDRLGIGHWDNLKDLDGMLLWYENFHVDESCRVARVAGEVYEVRYRRLLVDIERKALSVFVTMRFH